MSQKRSATKIGPPGLVLLKNKVPPALALALVNKTGPRGTNFVNKNGLGGPILGGTRFVVTHTVVLICMSIILVIIILHK